MATIIIAIVIVKIIKGVVLLKVRGNDEGDFIFNN
jgi:hypothetical protein